MHTHTHTHTHLFRRLPEAQYVREAAWPSNTKIQTKNAQNLHKIGNWRQRLYVCLASIEDEAATSHNFTVEVGAVNFDATSRYSSSC